MPSKILSPPATYLFANVRKMLYVEQPLQEVIQRLRANRDLWAPGRTTLGERRVWPKVHNENIAIHLRLVGYPTHGLKHAPARIEDGGMITYVKEVKRCTF